MMRPMTPSNAQRGAAILLALLIMTVLATLASAAIATHWRQQRTSSIVRTNVQQDALLLAAVLWGQNTLVQDAVTSKSDDLNEAWNSPIMKVPLAPFLGLPRSTDTLGAFVSIRIVDLNRKWNILNLKRLGTPRENAMAKHIALEVGMSPERLVSLAMNAPAPAFATNPADAKKSDGDENSNESSGQHAGYVPYTLPIRGSSALRIPNEPTACLRWLGLTNEEIARVQEFLTCQPEDGLLNINTAPPQFLQWLLGPEVGKIVLTERSRQPFSDIQDVMLRLQPHVPKASLLPLLAEQTWLTSSFSFAIEAEVTLDNVPWKITQTVLRTNTNIFPISTLMP